MASCSEYWCSDLYSLCFVCRRETINSLLHVLVPLFVELGHACFLCFIALPAGATVLKGLSQFPLHPLFFKGLSS